MPGEGWRSLGVGCSRGGGGASASRALDASGLSARLPGGLTALWGSCVDASGLSAHLPGGLMALWGRCVDASGLSARLPGGLTALWGSCGRCAFLLQPPGRGSAASVLSTNLVPGSGHFPAEHWCPRVPPAGPPPCQDPGLRSCSLCAPPLSVGFPAGANGKEPSRQCRRQKKHSFDFWVGKIPWRRAWQPTPLFLPGESHGQRNLVGYSP